MGTCVFVFWTNSYVSVFSFFLTEWITRNNSRDSLFIEENIKAIWCYWESGILERKMEDNETWWEGPGGSEMDKVKSVLWSANWCKTAGKYLQRGAAAPETGREGWGDESMNVQERHRRGDPWEMLKYWTKWSRLGEFLVHDDRWKVLNTAMAWFLIKSVWN